MCDRELGDLAAMFNPILKGWQQYYGRFHGSAMSVIWKHMNDYLVRWMMRKYKTLARHKTRARHASGGLPVVSRRPSCIGEWDVCLRLDDGSRMNREAHVRFCEGLGCNSLAYSTISVYGTGGLSMWPFIIDVFARYLVGWKVSCSARTDLRAGCAGAGPMRAPAAIRPERLDPPWRSRGAIRVDPLYRVPGRGGHQALGG